MTYLFTIHKS